MIDKFKKIFYFILPTIVLFLCPGQAAAYRVSGIVEFTYRGYESKIGDTTSSDHYWTQLYSANLSSYLWDPRFIRFSGGVGYSVSTYKSGLDSTNLYYDIYTSFLPTLKVSWDVFGRHSTQNVQSLTNIAGVDIDYTSYGGTLNVRLGSGGGNGSNNNYRNRSVLALPDIFLSRIHTESESQSTTSPLHETRDDTKAGLTYRLNSLFDLNLDSGLEEYENLVNDSKYRIQTANLASNLRVSTDGELRLYGRLTDRQTDNIMELTGADGTTKFYGMNLNFREREGFSHSYRYDYSEGHTRSTEAAQQAVSARVDYKINEEWKTHGGVDYTESSYKREPVIVGDKGDESSMKSGGLMAGVSYGKQYKPDFMGPFAFNTAYNYGIGFSDITSKTDGAEGSGWYYTNNVQLGIASTGWEKESVSLTYAVSNKRDHSPVNNDSLEHSYRFNVNTTRIPDTTIRGYARYDVSELRSNAGTVYTILPSPTTTGIGQDTGFNSQRRSLSYDLNINHIVSTYLNFTFGASQGQSTSDTFTLSTLPSSTNTKDEYVYGNANFTYPITRKLIYRAQLQEEYRSSLTQDSRQHKVNMNLDYRIRSIFVNLEYRWWETIPENSLKTEQQYYFVKLARPF